MANKIEIPKGNSRAIQATLTDPDEDALDLTDSAAYISVREDHAEAWYTTVHACDVAWDELVDADVVVTLSTDAQEGASSVLLTIAAGAGAGDILATDAITSTDLSNHSSIHVWLKSSVNCDAGDLAFLIDNTALCASPVYTLDVPALVAATWTKCVMYFDDTYHTCDTDLTANISIGIKLVVDKGAMTLHVDEVRAGKYLIERFAGSTGVDPALGIASFALVPEHTQGLDADTYDYDIQIEYTGGDVYTPIIDDFEVLDHATEAR